MSSRARTRNSRPRRGARVAPEYADIAVPLPLPGPLTYRLPDTLGVGPQIGCRARVRVGKRRLVGIIVSLYSEPPDLERILPVESVLDRAPILSSEILELGAFISDYYLAPIGETLRALFPRQLPAWGDRRLRLTKKGAFAQPTDSTERALRDALLELGSLKMSELAGRLDDPALLQRIVGQ